MRYLLSLLLAAAAMTAAAQNVQQQQHDENFFMLPEGGCHILVDIDEETGERTVYSGAEADAISARRKAHYASTADGLGSYGKSGVGVVNTIGDVTIPVILADFSDQSFMPSTTVESIDRWFNEEGYSDDGNAGSVRDYFIAQSGGMFRPYFKVMGMAHTGKSYATYGSGNANTENTEALANAVTGNWGYDGMTVSSGAIKYVPLCIIMYAGPGEHRGAGENRIWAKFSEAGTYFHSGLFSQYFKSFLFINECIQSGSTSTMEGIGTACHEISHALGLPDLYDTGGAGCPTPGNWDLMATGNYVNGSRMPMAMCALERSQCGWLQIKELSAAGRYRLAPSEAALVRNSSNSKEYYILENRTNNHWTPQNMDGGLLVYHVDYDRSAWENTRVNYDANHPRMMFVYANNAGGASYESDYHNTLYPSPSKNDELSPNSVPAMTAYTGSFSGKPIYNIRRDGIYISFDFINRSSGVEPIYNAVSEKSIPAAQFNQMRRLAASPLSSISQVKDGQLYALYNPHFTSYAIYSDVSSNSRRYPWVAGMTGDDTHAVSYNVMAQPYSPASTYGLWRVKKVDDEMYYFQNEGSGLYLTTPFRTVNSTCEWNANPSIVHVAQRSDGLFTISTSRGAGDFACVAPQNGDRPLVNWEYDDAGAGWQLVPVEEFNDNYKPSSMFFPVNVDLAVSGTSTENRSLAYVALQQTGKDVQKAEARSPLRVCQNMTDVTFTVEPNSVIRPTIGYNGSWMHGYFYIDYDQNGVLSVPASHGDRSKDLCAFSFWSEGATGTKGYNSSGNYIDSRTNLVQNNVISLPSAIAPQQPGTYHIRYKVDWDNIDPAGSSTIVENNGFIVDVTLVVSDNGGTVDPEPPVDPEHPSTPGDVVFPISFDKDATGKHSDTNRKLTYVAIQEEGGEVQACSAVKPYNTYQNLTSTAEFVLAPGAKFIPSIGYGGTWMHGYFYVDLDHDGTLSYDRSGYVKGKDLLAYTFWNSSSDSYGYNSAGTMLSGGNRSTVQDGAITMPAAVAPSEPGVYYARFKVDWNCIDPAGSAVTGNTIVGNNGFVVDVVIRVVDPLDLNDDGHVSISDVSRAVKAVTTPDDDLYGTTSLKTITDIRARILEEK